MLRFRQRWPRVDIETAIIAAVSGPHLWILDFALSPLQKYGVLILWCLLPLAIITMNGINDRVFRRWFKATAEGPKDLRHLQSEFLKSQKTSVQIFLPHLWLDICSCIADADRALHSRYRSYEWLQEFLTPSKAGGYSRFTPETFSKSILKFDEAPDEVILRLEEYNSDIRVRDISEEMVKFAMGVPSRVGPWIVLMEKIAMVLDEPKLPTRNGPKSLSARSENLHKALAASAPEVSGVNSTTTMARMRKFIERTIAEDSVEETSIERSWQVEHRRAVVDVLEHLDDPKCTHEMVCLFLDELKRLNDEDSTAISAAHKYLHLATDAFVQIVSGARPGCFHDAIQALREISKQRNQQYKHLYDEIKTMRAQVAMHQQIIACLEYRHVLESLPNKDVLQRTFSLRAADLKDAAPAWRYTWQLAVETELNNMLQEEITRTTAAGVGATVTTPATGTARPSTGTTVPPPPRLTSLLRNDFGLWVKRHPKLMNAMVAAGAPNVGAIQYSDWRSYQHGRQLYGELSNNIHTYGKTYDVKDKNLLKSDALLLEWLKPSVSEEDNDVTGVAWDDEWTRRGLPT